MSTNHLNMILKDPFKVNMKPIQFGLSKDDRTAAKLNEKFSKVLKPLQPKELLVYAKY